LIITPDLSTYDYVTSLYSASFTLTIDETNRSKEYLKSTDDINDKLRM